MKFNKTVYDLSRRDLLRSRKMLFAFIVSCIPAILVILYYIGEATQTPPHYYYPLTGEGLVFLGLVGTIPLTCLLLAGGSIADEAEERTLSYLLVRPITREALFASRTAAVSFWAFLLIMFQAITVFIVDALAFLSFADKSSTVQVTATTEMSVSAAFLLGLPAAVIVGGLAAIMYSVMFSAISVIFTKYHFFANLLWFVIWEVGFGFSYLPTAWLSANHSLRILASAINPSVEDASIANGYWLWLGLPLTALFLFVWWRVGIRVMKKRDFHVTSAAT